MNQQILQEIQNYISKNLVPQLRRESLGEGTFIKAPGKEPDSALRSFPFKTSMPFRGAGLKSTEEVDQNAQSTLDRKEEEFQAVLERFRKPPKDQALKAKPSIMKDIAVREEAIEVKQERESKRKQPTEKELEEYIKKTKREETFRTMLLKYIDSTSLTDAEVYKRAGLDRRHFSKIRCNQDYHPKKETAVMLCIGLRLNLEQTEELLALAGYSLSNSDTGDLILKFCIERKIYNLMEVNEALEYFGEKTLGVVS